MAYTVARPKLNFGERLYVPAVLAGLKITIGHFLKVLTGKTKVTMQYPEERWDTHLPEHYRGAPTLVKDEHGKERCVACQLCEFICPPRAITIKPGEIPEGDLDAAGRSRHERRAPFKPFHAKSPIAK